MFDKLKRIAEFKPKLKTMLSAVLSIIADKETGKLEVNFTQGAVSRTFFKKEII